MNILMIPKPLYLLIALAPFNHQATTDAAFIESWKKGTQQVQEQVIRVELSASTPLYETLVKDQHDVPRYKLSFWPGFADASKRSIIEWMVGLTDVVNGPDIDLLKPANDPGQDFFTREDRLGWLYPQADLRLADRDAAVVPFLAKRVIKIEGFYCIIQVKDFRFDQTKKGVLDSLTVEVEFANTQPAGLVKR